MIGGQASHAWAKVLIPGHGWTAFDPTLGQPVGLRHVRLAYGRDYGDVAPVRGVYKGRAGQRLSVDVASTGARRLRSRTTQRNDRRVRPRPRRPPSSLSNLRSNSELRDRVAGFASGDANELLNELCTRS